MLNRFLVTRTQNITLSGINFFFFFKVEAYGFECDDGIRIGIGW